QRSPDLGIVWIAEIGGHHADNGVLYFVQRDLFADNFRIRAKSPLPQAGAYHGYSWLSWFIFAGQKRPTENRPRAQNSEEIVCCIDCMDTFRFSAGFGQIYLRIPPPSRAVENLFLVP